MSPSDRILAFIKGFERLRLTGYLPTPNDKPTIGWGHTGPEVHVGDVWTLAQANATFAADVQVRADQLNKLIYGVPTTQGEYDALFSLLYNIGIANLRSSTLIRLHKLGRHQAAAAEFPKWDHQAGHVRPGLLRRRNAEAAIYLS